MPKDTSIKKTLVIGSGSIVIGQAAEFDYAGTQACQILKQEGVCTVLVNSNPATIMTDPAMADHVYIEPLTLPVIKRIIEKEKPDSLLPSLGGQTGLNLAMQLSREGFLQSHGVRLLGAGPDTIDKAEDRQLFKDTMAAIGQPTIPSTVTETVGEALAFAEEIGYPIIVRPAFTLGGSGGGIAATPAQLQRIAAGGIEASPIGQILVEQCIAGWKEIEFEVMRDGAGNAIAVCSMENFDPVGVHTGDSIVIAPAVTLADKEVQMLRSAALAIVGALGVQGGCNCQFALSPTSAEYAVIEVNPRVSRSSALASKATGYPIAKVATRIALGYTLPEIPNAVTGGATCAMFEPALDYVVVKLPRWPFDKFVYADRALSTQMKATGEVMAIGATFEEALMKAVRGAEVGQADLNHPAFSKLSVEELTRRLSVTDDLRLFAVYAALKAGVAQEAIHEITTIDRWFIAKLANLLAMEEALAACGATGSPPSAQSALTPELHLQAKRLGFPNTVIEKLTGIAPPEMYPAYKMVDTCAAEFAAETPYFYAAYQQENEAAEFLEALSAKSKPPVTQPGPAAPQLTTNDYRLKTIMVFGSGPIRIGQGIEFDYASVHCVWALRRLGYQVVIVNNNPETVSTDFDTADRLYFEPLTPEDVMGVVATEKPVGVVVAFGGQTAIKLTGFLSKQGVPILGTPAESIDAAEDRARFDALLEALNIARPKGKTVLTKTEALQTAEALGYPVLLRPSYVLGGQNMVIAFAPADVEEYMGIILNGAESADPGAPILIDQYLMGNEIEVDAICDGEDILIPGVMEHIERAGVHSGDSIAVYPPQRVDDAMMAQVVEASKKLALALKVRGLVNIQYLIYGGQLYVIEVNPRSSRTIPYLSKVTGVPMVELATRAMLGEKLPAMGYGTGLFNGRPAARSGSAEASPAAGVSCLAAQPPSQLPAQSAPAYVAAKVPVFSFEKLAGVDTLLGPEMKSTGEVMGLAPTLAEALYKGLLAAGYDMAPFAEKKGVLFSVKRSDRPELYEMARRYAALGCPLYATSGNAAVLRAAGLTVTTVEKLSGGPAETPPAARSGSGVPLPGHPSPAAGSGCLSAPQPSQPSAQSAPSTQILDLMDAGLIAAVVSTSESGQGPSRDGARIRRKAVEKRIPCLTSPDTALALADCLHSRYSEGNIELVDLNARRQSRQKLRFGKLQAAGNDYLCFIENTGQIANPAGLSVRLCRRHFGVGGEGVALLYPSDKADFKMLMFNLDGTEGVMAANAIRLLAKYAHDKGVTDKTDLTVETAGGLRRVWLQKRGGAVCAAGVDLGAVHLEAEQIPTTLPPDENGRVVGRPVQIGRGHAVTCVNVGNPHAVAFVDDVDTMDLAHEGPLMEQAAVFPQRVNAGFCRVVDERTLRLRVWERGSGETFACGTGACAAVVAAVENGLCPPDTDVTVKLRGGDLTVRYTQGAPGAPGSVQMSGPVGFVYEGEVEI